MKPTAWIRVDANSTIGRGHLSRCLALAAMLGEEFEVRFLVRSDCQSYCAPMLGDWGVAWIATEASIPPLLDSRDVLVVDSYKVGNAWRERLKPHVKLLVDINDIPGEILGADVVINHCPGLAREMYAVAQGADVLLGLEHAILRPEYLEYARGDANAGLGDGLFVSFGGADPYSLGGRVVEALLSEGFEDPIYLITAQRDARTHRLGQRENVHLLSGLSADGMRSYMLQARLLFVSASILCFEALALRRPIATLYYVENQRRIYEGLHALGAIRGMGFAEEGVDVSEMARGCIDAYHGIPQRTGAVRSPRTWVDGLSGERIRLILLHKLGL